MLLAGGHGFAYSAGAVTASIVDAVGTASIIALTQIATATVDGEEEAFVLSGGDMNLVNASSATGPASVISTGTVANATINAGEDATLVAVGDASNANLTAGADASVFAKQDMNAVVINATGNVSVVGYGSAQVEATAGEDIALASVGNMNAFASAGGSLDAGSFGNLSGDFHAGNDIGYVWARGDLTGTYSADHSIQVVLSYNEIDADITAGGSCAPEDSSCGNIHHVRAWHDIHGTITAENTIGGGGSGSNGCGRKGVGSRFRKKLPTPFLPQASPRLSRASHTLYRNSTMKR